jgi:hypothetical protein
MDEGYNTLVFDLNFVLVKDDIFYTPNGYLLVSVTPHTESFWIPFTVLCS